MVFFSLYSSRFNLRLFHEGNKNNKCLAPKITMTSFLWAWVQSLTVNMPFSHVDHAAAHKCRCQDVNLVTVSALAGNVLQGEVTVRFERCCSQVHEVVAPRLTLPGPQRQLMATSLGAPKGTSWFLKATPHMRFCLSHVRSVASLWNIVWTIAIWHCLLYSSIEHRQKKILHLLKSVWE